MNFDKIIMNPPFKRNLHLDILREVLRHIKEDGIIVNLSPARWLTDSLSVYKKTSNWHKYKDIRDKMQSLDLIEPNEVTHSFGGEDVVQFGCKVGIYKLTNKGGFDSSIFHSKVIKRIYTRDKFCGLPIVKYKDKKYDNYVVCASIVGCPKRGYYGDNVIRFNFGVFINNRNEKGLTLEEAKERNPHITCGNIDNWYIVEFEEPNEAVNFFDSCRLPVYRHIIHEITTDQNAPLKYAPFLPDYKHHWTDEELADYLGLTKELRSEI